MYNLYQMSDPADLLLGRIAIEMNLVEPEIVREALHDQACEDGARPLGEILVAKGHLSRNQLATLLAEQKRRTGRSPTGAGEEGASFGKFFLEKQIGKGGAGAIYQAIQTDLDRRVALKFLHSEDPEDVQRFLQEAQTATLLSHPNIVPIYEIGEFDGRHYLAMQYVEGKTLEKVQVKPSQAAEILCRVADAVQHAHDRGIVHRDLKPQNIMLEPGGHVWVMDFGLARQLKTGSELVKTETGIILGTPAYMPPELAQGHKGDRRGDIYSMGATLYSLLTHRPPFDAPGPLEVLRKAVMEEPISPRKYDPDISRDLVSVVLKAMEKMPEERYQTAHEFKAELERYQKGEPVLSKRRPWFQPGS